MKNRFLRVLLVLTAVMCAATAMALPSNAETSPARSVSVDYYGRYALSQEPNAKVLLYAYDQIVKGVEASAAEISVYDGKNPISVSELMMVYDAYLRDHTEHFWLGPSYTYSYTLTTVKTIAPDYVMSGSKLASAKIAFENAVSSMLAEIDSSMSDFEKELLLHDRLAQKVTYIEASNAHNAYGALVDGEAVCEGYAEALQYLLQRAGIQSFIAIGSSVNPSDGIPVGHAWNYVRIDGAYYQTDLTWDDQKGYTYHAYFNQTDAVMKEDHLVTETDYALPQCSSTAAQYFTVMGGKLTGTTYSADTLAERLKNNGLQTSVYVTESMSGFINWMKNNISDIGEKVGIKGKFTYSYEYLGRELLLTIIYNCDHANLTKVAAKSATCEESGHATYYICTCEKWFKDANGKTEIADKDSVKTALLGHDYTEKIMDYAHLKSEGASCRAYNVYWYDCSRCTANAKDDPSASEKYYTGTVTGSHSFTQKVEDTAHLVAGSGADCRSAKQYYYDCADCDLIGTAVWDSSTYGSHSIASKWSSDSNGHWHTCTVCGDRSEVSSHADGNQDGKCDDCAYVMTVPPSTTEPTTTEPATTEPVITEPTTTEPPTTEPPTTEPPTTKPVTTVPVNTTPVTTIPTPSGTSAGSTPSDAPTESPADADDSGSGSVTVIVLGTVGVLAVGSITVSVILIRKRKS